MTESEVSKYFWFILCVGWRREYVVIIVILREKHSHNNIQW